mmetsp:Transcript_1550/g.3320  ORF Transcript_1550/g.3320 Transcript_1550/m.3320 type:complete len:220 (+) Transcript_1550:344-1003(+)
MFDFQSRQQCQDQLLVIVAPLELSVGRFFFSVLALCLDVLSVGWFFYLFFALLFVCVVAVAILFLVCHIFFLFGLGQFHPIDLFIGNLFHATLEIEHGIVVRSFLETTFQYLDDVVVSFFVISIFTLDIKSLIGGPHDARQCRFIVVGDGGRDLDFVRLRNLPTNLIPPTGNVQGRINGLGQLDDIRDGTRSRTLVVIVVNHFVLHFWKFLLVILVVVQ